MATPPYETPRLFRAKTPKPADSTKPNGLGFRVYKFRGHVSRSSSIVIPNVIGSIVAAVACHAFKSAAAPMEAGIESQEHQQWKLHSQTP